ncbi:hypothetical protein JZ751_013012, partial [Albula glossodonta]
MYRNILMKTDCSFGVLLRSCGFSDEMQIPFSAPSCLLNSAPWRFVTKTRLSRPKGIQGACVENKQRDERKMTSMSSLSAQEHTAGQKPQCSAVSDPDTALAHSLKQHTGVIGPHTVPHARARSGLAGLSVADSSVTSFYKMEERQRSRFGQRRGRLVVFIKNPKDLRLYCDAQRLGMKAKAAVFSVLLHSGLPGLCGAVCLPTGRGFGLIQGRIATLGELYGVSFRTFPVCFTACPYPVPYSQQYSKKQRKPLFLQEPLSNARSTRRAGGYQAAGGQEEGLSELQGGQEEGLSELQGGQEEGGYQNCRGAGGGVISCRGAGGGVIRLQGGRRRGYQAAGGQEEGLSELQGGRRRGYQTAGGQEEGLSELQGAGGGVIRTAGGQEEGLSGCRGAGGGVIRTAGGQEEGFIRLQGAGGGQEEGLSGLQGARRRGYQNCRGAGGGGVIRLQGGRRRGYQAAGGQEE